MKRFLALVVVGWTICGGVAFGQSGKVKVITAKPWVQKVAFDVAAEPPAGQADSHYYLLVDEQEDFSEQERYSHYAYKILTSEGLQQMADISMSFDPAYEQLFVHTIRVHRGGEIIDKLPKNIKTIQREESMDRYIYDGSLTAVINLPDVRLGDVIEYAYTLKGYNPVHKDHMDRRLFLDYTGAKIFYELTMPKSMVLTLKHFNTEIGPQTREHNGKVTYTWLRENVKDSIQDSNYPDWYNPYQRASVSSYKSWGEVATWASALFTVKESDKQRLQQEAAQYFKNTDPEAYTLEVIRFVQDEVRYLGFESGLNTHMPYPPLKVYTQRFGDCKDKSLLLTTLLNARGIEAYPVLVNTSYRHKVSDMLPSAYAFDHCVTQIKLNGRTFYIDPTINGQGGTIGSIYFPTYGKGLVINGTSTDFVEFGDLVPSSTVESQTYTLTAVDGDAVVDIKTTYLGVEADGVRLQWSRNNAESIQKQYLKFYGNLYPDIEKINDISFKDDRDKNTIIVEEHYRVPKFWLPQEGNPDVLVASFRALSLGTYFDVSAFAKRTAPYALNYPLDYTVEMHINLPKAWSLGDEDTRIERDDYDYTYSSKCSDKTLLLNTHYKIKQSFVPADKYQQYVDDHKKMWDGLTYEITYNQKISAVKSARWPGILLIIVSICSGVALVLWLYRHYDPQPHYPRAWAEPLGGWLYLVAVGLTLSPVYMTYSLVKDNFINSETWLVLFYQERYAWGILVVAENIYNIVIIIFALLAVVLFYQRRSSAPLIISIFYGAIAGVGIIDQVLAAMITGQDMSYDDSRTIVRSVIAAAIWIPYFNISQRVKRTFVFSYREDEDEDTAEVVREA